MSESTEVTRIFYDRAYQEEGFSAQRLYPNEELLRFMGSHFFSMPRANRGGVRILEIGCGSCANLWMIAREGFEAHGLDLSGASLKLGAEMLQHWEARAALAEGSMESLPYPDQWFDAVVDVFSSYCLPEVPFATCLGEVARVLKPSGRFFSYTPSKTSDSFTNPGPSRFVDASTLDGIHRDTAPFAGQHYPFRFVGPDEYPALLERHGLATTRCERIGRTYRNGTEYFEFVSVHALKRGD
jgi:ubiquinone/menaquinone biosynthesis C-methylase UbiE